jgi:hypothetical protein
MSFLTRPHIEDRQFVQYVGEFITLSGFTNFASTSIITVEPTILDFTGTTTASTITTISGLSGYINNDNRTSGLVVKPPVLLLSGTTGTTTVDVTGYVLKSLDSQGTVYWGVDSGVTGITQSPLIYNPNLPSPNTSIVPDFGGNDISSGSTYSSILGGINNNINTGYDSSIVGGKNNIINGNNITHSTILGGYNNQLSGNARRSVIGGYGNNIIGTTSNPWGANGIPVGSYNTISNSDYSNINGGYSNDIELSNYSVIDGGRGNYIKANVSSIGGGVGNSIKDSGELSGTHFIGGGYGNEIYTNRGSSIVGGLNNDILGLGLNYSNFSFIGGGRGNTISGSPYSSIVGGGGSVFELTPSNKIIGSIRSFIGGGRSNQIMTESDYSSIVGGKNNILNNYNRYSSIVGGRNNSNVASHSFVGGGGYNTITGSPYSSIVGGAGNEITSPYSSIIGGAVNLISGGQYSGVGFGKNNRISGSTYSTILGGYNNEINNLNNTKVIGSNIVAVSANTTHVNNLNIYDTPQINNGLNDFLVRDIDGQIKVKNNLSSINPYYLEPSNTLITWNVSGNSTNYETTLTGNTTLNLINVRNGDFGTIIVKQDAVGNRLLSFGTVNGGATTHRVINGGGGSPTLTGNANAIDILTFTYNGTILYWTVGNDYT